VPPFHISCNSLQHPLLEEEEQREREREEEEEYGDGGDYCICEAEFGGAEEEDQVREGVR